MEARSPVILLVDDEEAIRRAMQRWLTRRGWTVVSCESGDEALGMLARDDAPGRFDAILCDLRMPGLSGVHLHDWLRDERPELHARLILATGDVASGEIARFLSTVSCPVIEKPFEFPLLAGMLDALLAENTRTGDQAGAILPAVTHGTAASAATPRDAPPRTRRQ